jgi:hypothetical protein
LARSGPLPVAEDHSDRRLLLVGEQVAVAVPKMPHGFYTTAGVATVLVRAEFTAPEGWRHREVRAHQQGSGHGKHQARVIVRAGLQRLPRETLLPAQPPP